MNRILKFCGKRIDNGEWIYGGVDIQQGDNTIFDHNCICHSAYEVDVETIGQYTETDDKHGNEIYTGHIVKAYKHGDLETAPFTREVTFRNGCYYFGNWNWHEFLNVFRYLEIVGNIYESEDE